MTTTLISFLGRSPTSEGSYRRTEYRFSDGSSDHAAFFGFSLQKRLRPDRLVIFGTPGSMWDHLFERDVQLGDQSETERLALLEAVASKAVTQAQLDALAPTLATALGCAVSLRLLPYAKTHAEQCAVVHALADAAQDSHHLHLDITHGMRHLPLLAMMSLQYLRATRPSLRIAAVWYGAFDPDTGEASVHDLSGLLEIADGAEALARFDADGDYSVLATLMPADAQPLLRQAAFYERTHQIGQARRLVKETRSALNTSPLAGFSGLFREALQQRLVWADESRLYQRQRQLALDCLARGDELRAALYGYEAFITRFMQANPEPGKNPDNFEHRQAAKERYEADARQHGDPLLGQYRLLRDLRNQLAHGVSPSRGEVQQTLASEDTLRRQLASLLAALLPDTPQDDRRAREQAPAPTQA